jgi:tetratricopeptide (TPR) repeat protein
MRRDFWRIALVLVLLGASFGNAETRRADDLVETARQAARANRHEEAIEAFQQAMAAAPERRREWQLELADQFTWSGRLDEAIALYREVTLADDPAEQRRARIGLARALSWDGQHSSALAEYDRLLELDPKDRETRLSRAQVLSWANRQGAALEEYRAVLREHPDDLEAQRAIGRVQSWRGRYRIAAAAMEQFLAKHPLDREATAILAESRDWMGRPDLAEQVVRKQLAGDAEDQRAAALLENLEFYQRPQARFDWRESHQSDDLRTTIYSLDSRLPLANGRSYVGLHYDLGSYRPPEGPVEKILVQRPGVLAHHRISDAFDWHGAAFLNVIDTYGAPGDHETPTYDTYFTFWPNDVFRFDLGSSRWTFDSEEALREGLYATQGNVSMDILPNELTRLTTRLSLADYSDGNERTWWQLEVERRIWHDPRILIGYRYTGFDFSEPGQGGYYNPDLYHSNELLLRGWGWFGGGRRWDLRSSVGYEHEIPGDSRLIWSAGAGLTWEIRRYLELELAYDFSSSSAASSSGFDRGTARLTLRYVF